MTFIDPTQQPPTPGLIAGYVILTLVSLACTIWAIQLGRHRTHYRLFFSVRVLFPIAILILALENATLAASGKLMAQTIEGISVVEVHPLVRAIFVLQTFEVPILLIVMFEVTYLIHKRRSVNFCGMYFDEGRRLNNTQAMSCMLRNSIRSLATVLLVMGLMVNFDFITSNVPIDELAGRAGWWTLFEEEGTFQQELHLLLSLLPIAVLVAVSFYLSTMMWRYGTSSSMIVHSSICNPWFYCFFGTLAMAAGQLFAEQLYPVMSNTGILIFIITIEAVMVEVDKDIVAIENEASFLVCVALKGDQISVARPSMAEQQQRNDTVLLQDEEIPTITSDQADIIDAVDVQAGGVVSSNLVESDGQIDVEVKFEDEETPAVKGVDGVASSTPGELNAQDDATNDDHNKETEERGATVNDKKER
ncbi:hypothetical protein QTG54_008622 [Skeletonema marinoi]|uniref:Uncharacterized protein n=2 Tax=Skeletonema marinoi TaxID=267567 RepID=A0AAD8Y7N6_9STRA|nr:hypothetical protein QTG54_008622 [Skeletonema marinoi]